MRRSFLGGLAGLISLFSAASTWAIPMTHTNRTAFDTAVSGMATSALDFDSIPAGTTIASGDTVGGITFAYDFGGVKMVVTDVFDTTSPPNFLGTDDADVFQDGDDFDLSFGPINGIGMFFITADQMFDDDILLSAGGATVGLTASDVQQTLVDGSDVFFLGITDEMSTFTTASITTIGGGFFLYNVDDIVTGAAVSVPEPGILWLFGTGLIMWLFTSKKRYRLA